LLEKGDFVGRQRELAILTAALDDSLSGQGGIVMLVGEPGIGKTRTARELAAYATLKGAQVLWGRCHSTEGAPPYWPWVQVIRAYTQGCEPEELRSRMGPGAADIAEIVLEVRECLPDLQPPPALEPQQARFRLFDSIRAFLKKASQFQPLLLVIDNLHWADRSSLLLLEFLAQELAEGKILVVGTYRDTELTRRHPLTQTLGELAREPLFRRVILRGLNEEEVGRFIEVHTAFTPSKDLVGAVYLQTEGNPLFVTEVVRLLVQEGKLSPEPAGEHQPWNIMIPVGVREVIGRHLDRLSNGCNDVLTVASVIGREFELDLLEKLLVGPSAGSSPRAGDGSGDSLSGDGLLEAVEEALGARVIEEIPHTVSRYQFAHVLIQDTLTQELSAARRARLHRRIAEALEGLYGPDAGTHAAELAYHLAQAGTATDAGNLVRYSLLAGEQALATYAHEEALLHFERGLGAKGGYSASASAGPAIDAETAALLFGLARAQLATSDRFQTQTTREPAANLRRAFDYYAEAGEVDQAVVVAEHPVQSALGVPIGESELITGALALVPANSHYVGRLLSTYGLSLYQETGDYDGAQEAFGRALEIARREEDPALEIRTLAHAADVDFHHLSWQEVLRKGQQVIELTRSAEDLQAEATAHFFMARVLDYQGDPGRAQQQAEVLLAQAERLRGRGFLSYALYITGVLSLHRGDWQAARDFLDCSLGLMPQSAPHLCARAVLEYQPGDILLGQGHVERLLEATRRSAMGAGFA
jgi:tetratricopeptide (TPR) repeat protein